MHSLWRIKFTRLRMLSTSVVANSWNEFIENFQLIARIIILCYEQFDIMDPNSDVPWYSFGILCFESFLLCNEYDYVQHSYNAIYWSQFTIRISSMVWCVLNKWATSYQFVRKVAVNKFTLKITKRQFSLTDFQTVTIYLKYLCACENFKNDKNWKQK